MQYSSLFGCAVAALLLWRARQKCGESLLVGTILLVVTISRLQGKEGRAEGEGMWAL